jgi:hypothetical protein
VSRLFANWLLVLEGLAEDRQARGTLAQALQPLHESVGVEGRNR